MVNNRIDVRSTRPPPSPNTVLAALPAADYRRLLPWLPTVPVPLMQVFCPECGGSLRFRTHYPVLAGDSARPNGLDTLNLLRYGAAWVCDDENCGHWVIAPEATRK